MTERCFGFVVESEYAKFRAEGNDLRPVPLPSWDRYFGKDAFNDHIGTQVFSFCLVGEEDSVP